MPKWSCLVFLLISLMSLARVALAEPPPSGPEPQAAAIPDGVPIGYPVRLAGEKVFRIYDRHAPEKSVRVLENRLLRMARDPFYSPDLLITEEDEEGVWVVYREDKVGFFSEAAASLVHMSAKDRAEDVINAIQKGIELYHIRQSPTEWTRSLVLVGVATLLFAAAIYLVQKLYRRTTTWIDARSRGGLKIGGQRLGFRNAERLLAFQQRATRSVRTVLILIFALVYLQAAFTLVPLTRGYALSLIWYLIDPLRFVWHGVLMNVGDFFFIAVIVALARLLLRGIRLLLTEAAWGSVVLPGIPRDRADPLYKIVRLVVIAITIVMVYPYIPGSSSAAFQGVSLFAGALFTLGASSTASNFIGGISLVFSGSFRVGDRVRIGSVVGDVDESTLVLTRVRTPKNELVTFSNGNVLNESFVNYSAMARKEGVILHTSITIGYDVPWRKVHELLIQAALRTEHVLEEPAPFVLQTSLNDFHVGYQINVYTREANRMAAILSELNQNIQDAFAEEGVEILSPTYTALRDGAASTTPPSEAPTST